MQFLLDYVVAILVLLLLDVAVISLHKIKVITIILSTLILP